MQFSTNCSTPNSYSEIRDYLFTKLKPILKSNRDIIFICIGTDRSTGDSLGPLIGYKLRFIKNDNIYIYGSLESPISNQNILDILTKIKSNFDNPYIITINSNLGSFHDVGKILINNNNSKSTNTSISYIGNMNITGIVNITGNYEFMILQNTRLHTVMLLADSISNGIYHFILKSIGKKSASSFDLFPSSSITK
jgi:putative sporulation protein YyaC